MTHPSQLVSPHPLELSSRQRIGVSELVRNVRRDRFDDLLRAQPIRFDRSGVEFGTVPISIQYATVKRFTFAGHGYLMPSRTTKNGEVRGWE